LPFCQRIEAREHGQNLEVEQRAAIFLKAAEFNFRDPYRAKNLIAVNG